MAEVYINKFTEEGTGGVKMGTGNGSFGFKKKGAGSLGLNFNEKKGARGARGSELCPKTSSFSEN